jgi:hypothetical protein
VPHRSEPRFLVLHRLRVKGFAEARSIGEWTGLDGVDDLVGGLADEALIRHREGFGWQLTTAGRTEHARLLGDELDASGAKSVVDAGLQRFLGLNKELLVVCTAWQLRSETDAQAINDHSDAEYDRGVLERLTRVHERVSPIVADLSAALERYDPYGPRLGAAVELVRAGDADWVTGPLIDSYHTVWQELHEDLMATLGIKRGEDT